VETLKHRSWRGGNGKRDGSGLLFKTFLLQNFSENSVRIGLPVDLEFGFCLPGGLRVF